MRSRLTYLLLIPVAFMLMGARSAPLVDPAPVPVPAGMAVKDVSKAIRAGVVLRGWVVSKDDGSKIDAVLNNRDHTVNIAIAYDATQVKVSYVSSDKMLYTEKNGTRYIHKKYMAWASNVANDISRELQAAAIKKE
ncbi:MAG: hypothetical protein ABI885_13115 [Gammaproteobacteria bacterium]